ncbi:hypothetical protein CISIN_1g032874mg [Citrus sinensis]|uniref:Uncharacterized protein n=1 Tax=Citrus sinensis TaxID=2711 RepID=A0A067GQQ4_CITSI|nr:hypothetical protein CISIN_1g032874mg [Citrus sinensis]
MLEKLWDDVVAGPQPDRGLGRLRKITTTPLAVKEGGEAESSSGKFQRSLTSPHILTLPLFMTGKYVRVSSLTRSLAHSLFTSIDAACLF